MIKSFNIKSKIKNILKERDEGKYKSIVDNITTSDTSSNTIISDNIENTAEVDTKKAELTNIAVDKIKQSLNVTDELQSILNQINKLNKENNYNKWTVNEEDNTAQLENKNAYIFKQNNNLCLSHNGKVELFKSVKELHDWLKEHNYPLPKNIKLHESNPLLKNQFTSETIDFEKLNHSEEWYINKFGKVLGPIKYRNAQKKLNNLKQDTSIPNEEELKKYNISHNRTTFKMGKDTVKDAEFRANIKKVKNPYKKGDNEERMVWNNLSGYMGPLTGAEPIKSHKKEFKDKWKFNEPTANGTWYIASPTSGNTAKFITRDGKTYHIKDVLAADEFRKNECVSGGVTTGTLGTAVQYLGNKKESAFKQKLRKLIGDKLQDITLKEDDTPADFATNISADMDNAAAAANATDTSTTIDTNIDPNMGMDTSMDADQNPQVGFGDININSGETPAEYGPEDGQETPTLMPPQPEYKIIDILINDQDDSDIKVKVENIETKETEILDLSEIDI